MCRQYYSVLQINGQLFSSYVYVLCFSFPTETAINIGYSCHLLTDDMTEVFTIDGESLESVQKAISECKNKILAGAPASRMQSKENSLKDVEVEVISYKDNYMGEISASTQVRKKRM